MNGFRVITESALAAPPRPSSDIRLNPQRYLDELKSKTDWYRQRCLPVNVSSFNLSNIALLMATSVAFRDFVGQEHYVRFDEIMSFTLSKLTALEKPDTTNQRLKNTLILLSRSANGL